MAIYKRIQNYAFEPRDIESLVAAYELTLRSLRLKDRDDPITQLVAEKIIAIGQLEIEDPPYSITSSASASTVGGISRLIDFAVLRLSTNK
jgi:hypothetical protein